MPLLVTCAFCGKTGRVPESYVGRVVKCRKCGKTFPAVPNHLSSTPLPNEPKPAEPAEAELLVDDDFLI